MSHLILLILLFAAGERMVGTQRARVWLVRNLRSPYAEQNPRRKRLSTCNTVKVDLRLSCDRAYGKIFQARKHFGRNDSIRYFPQRTCIQSNQYSQRPRGFSAQITSEPSAVGQIRAVSRK